MSPRHLTPVLALAAGLAPLALALPASAVTTPPGSNCGSVQTARTSIHYASCLVRTASGKETGTSYFWNDHGSAVGVEAEVGVAVNTGTSRWDGNTDQTYALTGSTGWQKKITYNFGCTAGAKYVFLTRVKQNNGSWGPTASSKSVTC